MVAIMAACLGMLVFAAHLARWVLAKDEGSADMQEARPGGVVVVVCVCVVVVVGGGGGGGSHAAHLVAEGNIQPQPQPQPHTRPPLHQISNAIRDGAEGYFSTQVCVCVSGGVVCWCRGVGW